MKFLVLAVWCAAVVVILLAGCVPGEQVDKGTSGLVVAVDSAHHVACYHFTGSWYISCVRVDR